MGVLSATSSFSEETITINGIAHAEIPASLDENLDVENILEDFKKLDFPKGDVKYSSDDLINYNDGQPANPFNKIAKVYGRHKDVFLFVEVVFNQIQQDKFMSIVKEKCAGDVKELEKFMKKMRIYMKRISKGMEDAKAFLPEELKACAAFFNGYHVDKLPKQRNIHENLNLNVTKTGTVLKTTELFNREIPAKEEGQSELRRLKIYANGQRAMTVYREGNGKTVYTPTKAASMELEVKWKALDATSGNEIQCAVVLDINDGRIKIKKGQIEAEGLLQSQANTLELAKQNVTFVMRKMTLFELLEKKVAKMEKKPKQVGTATAEGKATCMVDENQCREKLIPFDLPKQAEILEDKLEMVSNLKFSEIVKDPNDILNYNEGRAANPFDKLAKIEGRQKDVFSFNKVLRDPEEFGMMMKIVGDKCEDVEMKKKFIKRKDVYLKRVGQGELDAKEILGNDFEEDFLDAFTHGYHAAREGHRRNIHGNLNINLKSTKGALETSEYFTKITPRMEKENSEVERVKIYGNGRRLANIIKNDKQRKYNFSAQAAMGMEVEWVAKKGERDVDCFLMLNIKRGKISVSKALLDKTPVEPMELLELAKQNKVVMIGNKTLYVVLEDLLNPKEVAWGNSKENLVTKQLLVKQNSDDTGMQSLYRDVSNLDYSNGQCLDPNDKLNYNDGLVAPQFCKLQKYWGRHKDILMFLSAFEKPEEQEKILKIVEDKCQGKVEMKELFEKRMKIFLERMKDAGKDGKEFLEMFLGDYDSNKVSAIFGGYNMPQNGHERNIHANLNVSILDGNPELILPTSEFFVKTIPRMEKEKSKLKRIKIYGNGERIMTILEDSGQRNYTFAKNADMDLGIEWSSKKKDDVCGVQHKGNILLNVKRGKISVLQTLIDGGLATPSEIVELSKENKEVKLRGKPLTHVLKEWLLKEKEPVAQYAGCSAIPPGLADDFVIIQSSAEKGDGNDGGTSDDMMGDW